MMVVIGRVVFARGVLVLVARCAQRVVIEFDFCRVWVVAVGALDALVIHLRLDE